jgi:exodeoxyribonuclease V gamma subunit
LGLDGEVVFCTVSQQEATDILQRLLKVYLAAWERPLPVACKTAWAWIQAVAHSEQLAVTAPDKPWPDPHDAARTTFESDFHRSGERDESAYLGRAFESYDALMAELPGWAQQLYGDLARHVKTGMPSSFADELNTEQS